MSRKQSANMVRYGGQASIDPTVSASLLPYRASGEGL